MRTSDTENENCLTCHANEGCQVRHAILLQCDIDGKYGPDELINVVCDEWAFSRKDAETKKQAKAAIEYAKQKTLTEVCYTCAEFECMTLRFNKLGLNVIKTQGCDRWHQ
jgi:hypothetical protein